MPRSRSETSRSPRRASTVARSTPASVAISRRDSGRSATNRSASSAASVSSRRRGAVSRRPRHASRARRPALAVAAPSAGRRSRERLQRLVERRVVDVRRRRRPLRAPRRVVARATIGPHGSACSTTISRRFISSSIARNVTATTTRSRTPRSRSWRTIGRRAAERLADDRGALGERDRPGDVSGGGSGGGAIGARPVERREPRTPGRAAAPSGGRAPARPAAERRRRLAPEQPDPVARLGLRARRRRRGRRGRGAAGPAAPPRDPAPSSAARRARPVTRGAAASPGS